MEQTTQPMGWIDSITSKFNFDSFLKQFNVTTATVVEVSTYFGAGLAIGFLAKRYLKQLIVGIILVVLFLKGLEYFGVSSLTVNWTRIKELTGIAPTDTIGGLAQIYLAWLQTHVRQTVSAVIGFLVGMKLG